MGKLPANKYKVRHIRQSINDFQMDIHRFKYTYNGVEHEANLIGAVTVHFKDFNPPQNIQEEVMDYIYKLFDAKEKDWNPPKRAYELAEYYANNY